jgi:hypothetical protein
MTSTPPIHEPLATSVGEIARLYDLPESDVLDEAVHAGCRSFWWEGTRYGADEIRQVIKDWWRWDLTGEIELNLTGEEAARLERALGGDEAGEPKPLRKFVPSQTQLPHQVNRRRQRMG